MREKMPFPAVLRITSGYFQQRALGYRKKGQQGALPLREIQRSPDRLPTQLRNFYVEGTWGNNLGGSWEGFKSVFT